MYRHTVLFTIGFVGAIFFAQFPAFYDQYTQRLGGALAEVQLQATNITNIAASVDKTPIELIDDLIWEEGRNAAIGRNYAAVFERRDTLITAQSHLHDAPAWGRPFALARYQDQGLLQGTWQDYAPSMPVTWAGFIYAALGFFVAGVVFETLLWILWLPFSFRLRRT